MNRQPWSKNQIFSIVLYVPGSDTRIGRHLTFSNELRLFESQRQSIWPGNKYCKKIRYGEQTAVQTITKTFNHNLLTSKGILYLRKQRKCHVHSAKKCHSFVIIFQTINRQQITLSKIWNL